MPKCSSKVRSALENLGHYAKKRKVSVQVDKENNLQVKHTQIFGVLKINAFSFQCPAVDTTILVSVSSHEYRPDIQLSEKALDIPKEDLSSDLDLDLDLDSDSDSDSDSDLNLDSDFDSNELNWDSEMCAEIEHGPSEGFEMFEGASLESDSPGEKEYIYPWHPIDACIPPSLESAKLALCDLKNLLNPPCDKGHRPKVTGLTSILERCLSWMEYFLHTYVQGTGWSVAALQTAQFVGKGPYMARKVREWSKVYIQDRKNLPMSKSS